MMMFTKMNKSRKGGFLVDTLLGMIILLMGIIPLVASIGFAYSALTSSVIANIKLNEEFYSSFDIQILECTLGERDSTAFVQGFNTPMGGANVGVHGGFVPTLTNMPMLYYKAQSLDISWRQGNNSVKVYVVRRN